ncbi:inositol monophosphatase family protein [Sulfurimonas sp. HSL3-7]|uniref:inositol monophosphatase family protein n=1 Tax=Sulfonitrofixus jiaomeiensis TaxID=3131938 RepID=UPI0031F94582
MDAFIEACFKAAIEVEAFIRSTEHHYGCEPQTEGAGGDLSINYDLLAEEIFVKHLSSFGKILSEESGSIGEGKDLIIIDPVDGSDNLMSEFPYYGTSIALKRDNRTVAGIVCNFANGDCFVRTENEHYRRSLFREDEREDVHANIHAKVGLFEKPGLHPDAARTLMDTGFKFRSPGAVALSLAYAHSALYMVFVGPMRLYDVEAGLYLCEDLYTYRSKDILIVSHNKDVFAKILTIFNLSEASE